MGVKTKLLLSQAQELFPDKNILALIPTDKGVIDTTYIVHTHEENYVLKKYERASIQQIQDENHLLTHLNKASFHLPKPIAHSASWQLFSYIPGEMPHAIEIQQLQSIGLFLGKFHKSMHKKVCSFTPFHAQDLQKSVQKLRKKHLTLAKKFSSLKNFPKKHDGIIHGDLFPDNVKFDKATLGVFDFIEAGNGSFSFDLGVVAMSWIAKKKFTLLRLQVLLKAYNQATLRKISLPDILMMMEYAALIYALKRFNNKSSLDYKEMLETHKKIKAFKKEFLKTVRG